MTSQADFRYSANTGYLWRELPFLDRIRHAARHGFDGLEFHDEAQREDRATLKSTLAEAGLPVFGLNIRMGDTIGCAALPDHAAQARDDIDAAIELAEDIGARAIHVLAGVTSDDAALGTYLDNLRYALERTDRTILIEPVSHNQMPGYFLRTIDQAASILEQVNHPRLRIMFDCFHIHMESGDVAQAFRDHADKIAHVQISAAEGRAEPLPGALDYSSLLPLFRSLGYSGAFGCEYRPATTTEAGLGWRELI